MSHFTPADAEYIKETVKRLIETSDSLELRSFFENTIARYEERDAELARLEAFIDGCTLEGKGNGHY